jgi:hypothetical protein
MEAIVAYFNVLFHHLEALGKLKKILVRITHRDRELNPGTHEYEAERLAYSVLLQCNLTLK